MKCIIFSILLLGCSAVPESNVPVANPEITDSGSEPEEYDRENIPEKEYKEEESPCIDALEDLGYDTWRKMKKKGREIKQKVRVYLHEITKP